MLPPNRIRRLAIAAVTAITLLGACASPNTPGTGGNKGGANKLTLWHAYVGQQDKVDFMSQTLEAFGKAHPEIQLDVVGLEQNAYKTKLQTAMASGQAPDVFYTLPGGYLQNFAKSGQILALDDALAVDGWKNTFLPTALAQVQTDGKTYAVPIDTDAAVIWYNKALFASKNWQVPTTWNEFLALCEKIKADGIAPISLGNKDAWPATFWFQYGQLRREGPGMIAKYAKGDAPSSLGESGVKSLEAIRDLAEKEYFTSGFNGMSDQDANLMFLNSKAAMVLNGTWQIGSSKDAPQGFEIGYFPFPKVEGGKSEFATDAIAGVAAAFAISANSPHKDAALTFLRFLTSQDVMTNYVQVRKTMVNVRGATNESAAGPILFSISTDVVDKASALDPFYDTSMPPQAMQTYYNTLQGVLDGSVSATDGAARLHDALTANK